MTPNQNIAGIKPKVSVKKGPMIAQINVSAFFNNQIQENV